MARMKNIKRWGLMRSAVDENIQEHSLQVAMIAHALALIAKRIYGKDVDPEHVMAIAAYHETSEVLTGDLPTPIKYYNPQIKEAYKEIEAIANEKLLGMIPEELRSDYRELIADHSADDYVLVKAADKICAYLKCIEELRTGNDEFKDAKESLLSEINRYDLPEVRYFMTTFAPSFALTLDEMK